MYLHVSSVAKFCMIKSDNNMIKWRVSQSWNKTLATILASASCGWRWGIMASVWVALWGIVLCAQALRAPVAGWTYASAGRMTPAIPMEFGLYSCIWLDRNKGLHCTRAWAFSRYKNWSSQRSIMTTFSPIYLWQWWSVFPTLRMPG